MKKRSKHISAEDTIVKFLNGNLSESGREEFDCWLNEDSDNKKVFEEIKRIWDLSKNIGDLQSLDSKGDWAKVRMRINFKDSRAVGTASLKRSLIWFRRVAAAIILLVGIGLLAKQFLFTSPNIISVSTTDYKDEIILPDGSKVFLNKYSELKYPEKFKRLERQVDLSGEGYFEVTKDPDKLFRINIDNNAIVEVLGTSFNISSQRENGSVDVQVVSGRVAFFIPESDDNKTILNKDEGASLQNGTISKDNFIDRNFLSWKTGILFFENEKFENVLRELTEHYNKKFTIKNLDDKGIRFTSIFDNQELESVLEEIKLVLNLDYSFAGDTIIFTMTP